MSLLFQHDQILLVDHKNKTISGDLYDLLEDGQTQEDDTFDGKAFELANETTLSEKQVLKKISEREISDLKGLSQKKIEMSLQTWERHRK